VRTYEVLFGFFPFLIKVGAFAFIINNIALAAIGQSLVFPLASQSSFANVLIFCKKKYGFPVIYYHEKVIG
jgi:hypothetical protein